MLRTESRHRALVENAPIGIIVVDSQGRIEEANQALMDLLGSPVTKAINMFTFPPLVESGISREFRRCVEEGCSTTLEAPYTSKRGKKTHLKARLTALKDPVDGSIKCLGVIEEVSIIKKAGADLQDTLNLMRQILNGISSNVAFVNEKLEIVWVNKAAAASVERQPQEMIGKTCHSFWADPRKTLRRMSCGKSYKNTEIRTGGGKNARRASLGRAV